MPEMEVDNKEQTVASENGEQKKSPNDAVYDPTFLPDMLPVYYRRLFPHKPFYRWLSYGLCKYMHTYMFEKNNLLSF